MTKKIAYDVMLLAWSFIVLVGLSRVSVSQWVAGHYVALGLALLPLGYVVYRGVEWSRRRTTRKGAGSTESPRNS